jgi:SMC interacting uncharacterized protein involved in chromosome segregation
MIDKKGQSNIEGIIGAVLSFVFLIIFLSALIPMFNSLNGCEDKQTEIETLNNKINELNQLLDGKEVEISELNSTIDSIGDSLGEKDELISNLTGQLKEKEQIIKNLNEELSYFQEKKYLQEINNNYFTISNYFERIENKFFPISISISLISITLFALILKEFAVISFFKRLIARKKQKEETKHETKE